MRLALLAPLEEPVTPETSRGELLFLVDLARGLTRRGHALSLVCAEGSRCAGVRTEVVPREDYGQAARRLARLRPEAVAQHALAPEAFALVRGEHVLHTLARLPRSACELAGPRACAGALAAPTACIARAWEGVLERPVQHLPHGAPELRAAVAQPELPEPFALIASGFDELATESACRAARAAGLHPVVVAGELRERAAPGRRGRTELGRVPRALLRALLARASCTLRAEPEQGRYELLLAESLLAGTPVVALHGRTRAELVRDGRDGALVRGVGGLPDALVLALACERDLIRASARLRFGLEPCLDRYERALSVCAHPPASILQA